MHSLNLVISIAASALLSQVAMAQTAATNVGKIKPVALIEPHNTEHDNSYGLLLGGWHNGEWLQNKMATHQLDIKQSWQILSLDGQYQTSKSIHPPSHKPPCEDSSLVHIPSSPSRQHRLAISPYLKAQPRPIHILSNQNTFYRQEIRSQLIKKGVLNPIINMTNAIRVDLDGDGRDEVILAASYFANTANGQQAGNLKSSWPPPHAGAGDYSIMLMRYLHNGVVKTKILHESIFIRDEKSDAEWQMPTIANLAGIADLNGDNKMELVIWDAYYEGFGARVFEWTPELGLIERLNAGCGV